LGGEFCRAAPKFAAAIEQFSNRLIVGSGLIHGVRTCAFSGQPEADMSNWRPQTTISQPIGTSQHAALASATAIPSFNQKINP
jgi:hypothetical protein